VLILSRDETISVVDDLVVCPATGTIRGYDTEVELSPDEGMPRSCVLNLANTTSAEKAMLTERIAELGAAKMDEACRALATATDCG
jgi:mRNA-degrading endonuclease toxin of MazEF toxin-antitoxin module